VAAAIAGDRPAELGGGDAAAPPPGPATGPFRVRLGIDAPQQDYVVRVTAPTGFATEDRITVLRDDAPPAIEIAAPPPARTRDDAWRLQGRVSGSSEVTVNDVGVDVPNGELQAHFDLVDGRNRIVVAARDPVGNAAMWGRAVVSDRQPPEVGAATVTPPTVEKGGVVVVAVQARDASDLKRGAPFALRVGNSTYSGTLTLDRGADTYRSVVTLPAEATGRVELQFVTLEDALGNKTTRRF
jgi:hypothetical protein